VIKILVPVAFKNELEVADIEFAVKFVASIFVEYRCVLVEFVVVLLDIVMFVKFASVAVRLEIKLFVDVLFNTCSFVVNREVDVL
jgi:hypothetical protein